MSVYNTKLISYPNGTVQIRKYSKPIRSKSPSSPYEKHTLFEDIRIDKINKEKEKLIQNGCIENGYMEVKGKVYTISPFDNAVIEEHEETKEVRNEHDIWHSINRAKNKIHAYSRCAKWEYFLTFTFDGEKIDRYNYEECSRAVRKWLNNQRRNAPDLMYLVVPEQHKDGAWHFHGVVANVASMKFSDSGVKDKKGRTIYNMSKWSLGFSTATSVGDVNKVSGYICKYITKELCEHTKGKQRYFVSQNMPEPEVSTFFILEPTTEETNEAFDNFTSVMCDSLGMDIVYASSPRYTGAFVDVDYLELQERIFIE